MKSAFYITILFVTVSCAGYAQKVDKLITEGNEAYKLEQYDKAAAAFKEALAQDPKNATAAFNLGNTLYKAKKYQEAGLQFDALARQTDDRSLQAKALYNKGVSYTQQKKLEESIEAYKQALRLNATDTFARENLQRALNEKKQQQPPPQQNNQQQKKQEQPPKQKPNKLNQQQVQQLLKALEEQERKLQEKLMKKPPVPGQPDKDW